MAEEPDQNALVIIEELWDRIRERLTEISAPVGGWTVGSMSAEIQAALSNATSANSAVQAAVSEVNSANKGKLLEIGENGTISVPTPLEGEPGATSPTPRDWVVNEITQAILEYSQEASSPVISINGKTGAVTLTASDVNARPAGVNIPQSDIEGLTDALNAKASTQALNALDGTIDGRIATGVSTSIGPINTSVTELSGRVANIETEVDEIDRKPAGGWKLDDLDGGISHRIGLVANATPAATPDTLVLRNSAGTFSVQAPTNNAHPTTRKYVDDALGGKANQSTVSTLSSTIETKADKSALTSLSGDVSALDGRVTGVETALTKKIELETDGKLSETFIPALPISRVTGLQDALNTKPSLSSGKLALSTIPSGIPQDSISGLAASFNGKADLVGGKIPTGQIPAIATHETYPVASKSAMLALTTSQVQIGDVAIITTAGADQGTYTLVNADPSKESSWLRHQAPQDAVLSVNGKQGTVVLSASDVGARALGGNIVQGDVVGLTTALNDRATKAYVDTEVAKKATPSDVAAITSTIAGGKLPVDLVATSNQITLSGLRSVDGVLMQAGQRVLLTAQQASSNNGIWVVSTGEWTRGSDMPQGSSILPGASVVVKYGAEHAQSIWQLTNANLITVGTGGQQWTKGYSGKDPIEYSAGHGLQLNGTTLAVKLGASSGLISDSAGLRLDPSSAVRKIVLNVPAGSTTHSLTHNLGTNDVSVTFIDIASQEMVLVPWTVINSNSISCEFAVPTPAQAYKAIVIG